MDFSDTRRHQRGKTPRWCRREHATTGTDQTPGPFLVSRHPLSEGRPLLAVSGSSRGPARCVVASSLDSVWSLAIAVAQGTWACSRLSPPVPGPRGGRGHKCRTPPRACSVSNAILAIRKVPGWHVRGVPSAIEVAVHAWLVVRFIGGRRAATNP